MIIYAILGLKSKISGNLGKTCRYIYICRERKSEGAEKREKERKGEIEIERKTERGERQKN